MGASTRLGEKGCTKKYKGELEIAGFGKFIYIVCLVVFWPVFKVYELDLLQEI